MCRLLGVITEFPVDFRFGLETAPSSLAAQSDGNPHGWGMAVHDPASGWSVEKCPMRADRCDHFHQAAARARGDALVAHVRYRSVGAATFVNTHPFRRGAWVFAHNGTVADPSVLDARTSGERRSEIAGETDSEKLFAFVLTAMDAACARGDAVDAGVRVVASTLAGDPRAGACNFLLSDGTTLYAFRLGRPMFVMSREDEGRRGLVRQSAETGARLEVDELRGRAVFVASQPLDGAERWSELADGDLLRIDRTRIHRRRASG